MLLELLCYVAQSLMHPPLMLPQNAAIETATHGEAQGEATSPKAARASTDVSPDPMDESDKDKEDDGNEDNNEAAMEEDESDNDEEGEEDNEVRWVFILHRLRFVSFPCTCPFPSSE